MRAPSTLLDATQPRSENHPDIGGVEPSSPTPIAETPAIWVPALETLLDTALTALESQDHVGSVEPSTPGPILGSSARIPAAREYPHLEYDHAAWVQLRLLAEAHNAAQQFRIAIGNRLLHTNELEGLLGEPQAFEDRLMKLTVRQMRITAPASVRDWQKTATGIGEVMLARLLGSIGHPIIATPSHWEGAGDKRKLVRDSPFLRTPRQLRQYCGHGDPARSRRVRGMSAEEAAAAGSPHAKMLVYLMAEKSIMQPGRTWSVEHGGHWKTDLGVAKMVAASPHVPGDSEPVSPTSNEASNAKWFTASGNVPAQPTRAVWPYRAVYEAARTHYQDRVHADVCVRCGPGGRPALAGSSWSLKHQHAAALRKVGQEILMGLWKAANCNPESEPA